VLVICSRMGYPLTVWRGTRGSRAMARKLRQEDPRCGREHFDLRAGIEWECGPDPNDVSGSKPDVPWPEYARTRDAPRVLQKIEDWRVTSFGLELVSSVNRFDIPADRLLDLYPGSQVYMWPILAARDPWIDLDIFEHAFREAIRLHPRKAPLNLDLLYKTFRRARGMARRRARDKRTMRNLPPRLPRISDAIIITVERLLYASTDVWLRCQGPESYRTVFPRPPTLNDVHVITAAYPTFFSRTFDGPQTIYCGARWERNDWFLLACGQPRTA
jgi:hypothetical protein